jgi:hypothetical protein
VAETLLSTGLNSAFKVEPSMNRGWIPLLMQKGQPDYTDGPTENAGSGKMLQYDMILSTLCFVKVTGDEDWKV